MKPIKEWIRLRFTTRSLSMEDAQRIAGWRYAAPYHVYDEKAAPALDSPCRALVCGDELCGYFCWAQEARVQAANDVYQKQPDLLDFGIAMRPDCTGKGLGLFACGVALDWLRDTFHPKGFRLAVYVWNVRAQQVYARLGFVPMTVRGEFQMMVLDDRFWREATRPLVNGMAVYPHDPGFDRHLHYHKETTGWDMSVFSMSAHTGTHLDAPAHIGRPGSVEMIPLSRLNGSAQLVDWRGTARQPIHSPRLLIRTGGRGLRLSEAQALVDAGVILLGIDGMSVGEGADEWAVHALLLETGVAVLENAALEDFAPGWYEMRCLPLYMPGSDGVPVRLLLRAEGA